MQLTDNELQRNVAAANKTSYFLKNPNKVLVIDMPSGDLRFTLDLSRLSPFLLEYLTYYQDGTDRDENLKFNKDKYGIFTFLESKVDTATAVTDIATRSAQFGVWYADAENAQKITDSMDSTVLDGIMRGLGMTDEEVFYLVRDDCQKISGIDLSDIEYNPGP